MSNTEKLKALKLTIDKIDKDFGKGSVMMMSDKGIQEIEVISTGSIGLDVALGIGGLPKGRVIEIYGPLTIVPNFATSCYGLVGVRVKSY